MQFYKRFWLSDYILFGSSLAIFDRNFYIHVIGYWTVEIQYFVKLYTLV